MRRMWYSLLESSSILEGLSWSACRSKTCVASGLRVEMFGCSRMAVKWTTVSSS
jgi:hypothetical protein